MSFQPSSTVPYVFQKPARAVTRVFLHCSASDNPDHDNAATMDAWHKQRGWSGIGYHLFIRKSGLIEKGRDLEKVPAAQAGHNTGTIAVCLHGLAVDRFTEAQFSSLIGLCQQINIAYGGRVTFHGHREVANKACPVFDYKQVLGLDGRGYLRNDRIVAKTRPEMPYLPADTPLEAPSERGIAVLRSGDRGRAVMELQNRLAGLGYFPGAIDGEFGSRTRAAVLAFQADNDLVSDGIFGPASREALFAAKPRAVSKQRASATVFGLASGGSRIAQASVGNGAAGVLIAGGGALTAIEQASGVVSQLTGYAGVFGDAFTRLGPIVGIVIVAAGAFVVWQSIRAGRARAQDHRTGRTA